MTGVARVAALPWPDDERSRSGSRSEPSPAIRIVAASKDYGPSSSPVRALDGVDLAVPRGQVVSLLGPSGSGKSTLLRLVAGLEAPTSGRVEIFGREISSLPPDVRGDLRLRGIGQVFQGARLLPGIDVRENVALPLAFLRAGRARSLERADEILDRVGIARATRARRPCALTGADRQRVAIARALVAGPGILLADEPSGSLDSRSARGILDLLSSLAAEATLTLVVATHATEAATFGHRTVVLRDGRVVRDVSAEPRRVAALRRLRLAGG